MKLSVTLSLVISLHSALAELTGPETSSELESPDQSRTEQDKPEPISVGEVLRDLEQTILETKTNSTDYESLDAAGLETDENSTGKDAVSGKMKPRLNCVPVNRTAGPDPVSVINGTELGVRLAEENNVNVTNRTFPGTCSLTLFYASWCDFSAKAAPFYNALPRYFPGINFYAIDSTSNLNIYAQYGVIALPTILVFHNGRPLYRFNHSEHSLERYNEFLSHLSGIQPENISVHLVPEDLQGPVPTVAVKQFNYNLLLAALFLVLCGLVELSKSTYFRNMVDNLRNAWREAEIHQHTD